MKVKLMFWAYGIPVDEVINQSRHDKKLKEHNVRSSKFPPAFGIDIHVDDSPGLIIESERFNFKAVVVNENDVDWHDTVLNYIILTTSLLFLTKCQMSRNKSTNFHK
jgi:hypothetical protein